MNKFKLAIILLLAAVLTMGSVAASFDSHTSLAYHNAYQLVTTGAPGTCC